MTPEVTARRKAAAAHGVGFGDVLVDLLEERRPDFVIVFPAWFPYPAAEPGALPSAALGRDPRQHHHGR